ncbi:MAG: hypothetical protein AMXMBFR44_1110 [Candidatus Campbellbacteria bacterium]
MQPKEFFIERIARELEVGETTRIVDLGSGQSRSFLPLLERFPKLSYIGIEPRKEDADTARALLSRFPNVRIYNQLAYEPLRNEAQFDLCVSLSVLEHVKQIERFLKNSVQLTKSGGYIIHRYDLGHSLLPSSLKERLQVFLGNNLPFLLSEKKYVCYLDPEKVRQILKQEGAQVTRMTYHQMPNHKRFLKTFIADTEEKKALAERVLQWEFDVSPYLLHMPKSEREILFPAIAVWAQKH